MGRVRVVNKMPQFIESVQRDAARAIAAVLGVGAGEASVLTPIHSSTLINSQFRSVGKDGNSIVGTVGYTANYAQPVHDPGNPQNFRRPSAEKEFLRKGFERTEPKIRAILESALRR